MTNLERPLGQMAQAAVVGWGMHLGANRASRELRLPDAGRKTAVAQSLKKRGGCKTCDGTACVGRCRF